MLHIRTAVEVEHNPIRLDLQRGNNDAVPKGRSLTLLVDHLSVLRPTGTDRSIRSQRHSRAHRQRTMSKPLLRLEISNQLTTPTLCHWCIWQRNMRRGEIRRDVSGRST